MRGDHDNEVDVSVEHAHTSGGRKSYQVVPRRLGTNCHQQHEVLSGAEGVDRNFCAEILPKHDIERPGRGAHSPTRAH